MATRAEMEVRDLTQGQVAVIRTLLYFDVFHHPLRVDEIAGFLGCPVESPAGLGKDLEALHAFKLIATHDDYHGFGDVASNLKERLSDQTRAERRMAKARRMSNFIGRFPFVRAVMLSGSISKGRLAPDGDIDYFVITEPGRLWIARTLLIAFKKLFLFNSRRDFCLNYFVDRDHLTIEDRNLFTATEILTLIPTFNGPLCADFFRANTWVADLLPSKKAPTMQALRGDGGIWKRALERLFLNGLGDELDEWCMLRTLHHWRHKFAEFDRQRFDLALRTRKYVSKHHPRNFQQRVLDAFDERIQRFETVHRISLSVPAFELADAT